jgi:hypothetical protein
LFDKKNFKNIYLTFYSKKSKNPFLKKQKLTNEILMLFFQDKDSSKMGWRELLQPPTSNLVHKDGSCLFACKENFFFKKKKLNM